MSASNRANELFDQAIELESMEERIAFLNRACNGDEALRQRVERLLAAHGKAGAFLDDAQPAQRPTILVQPISEEGPGTRIGRYKLLQQIGEGGCGAVYMAEQQEPVRRRVALKVIKLGMDTRQVIARFEAERQALALMDHPNIAKVLDAGTTEAGRPFFVMELVRGIKITDYCDENNLSTLQRLDLFIKVCKAVQHAHQKGIVHRDLKPSNVLVTVNDSVPVPKVIDFGIAKATSGQQLTDKTLFTAFEQFIGTPAYMSPEQAVMTSLDIDTRSDIYSLGVLLYELLTGKTPFDAKELLDAGLEEMRRTIREKEPVRPSTRFSTMREGELTVTAKHRQADPSKLSALLRGDLDWIVMKCLEKDRTRRYETANGLSMDVQRHLNNEPILARPPSNFYRIERMVRRNKLAFAAAAAVTASLLVGLVTSTWLWAKERKAHQTVVMAEAKAQAEKLSARKQAYGSDINLAQHALADSNLGQALELLNGLRPQPGQEDLRGWEWRYLWQQCRSEAICSFQDTNWLTGVAASPDGRWLVVSENVVGGLSVWDLATRRPAARLRYGGRGVMAFSPKSSVLAYACKLSSGTNDYGICLWDSKTGHEIGQIPNGEYYGLAWSDDEQSLATSSWDGTVRLWQLNIAGGTVSPVQKTSVHFPVYGREFAANRDLSLVARGGDGPCVFNLRTGAQLWRTNGSFWGVAFSPDGRLLAAGSGPNAGPVKLWESTTGRELARLDGHRSWIGTLVFATNGEWLASASGDQTIRIWDIRDLAHVPPARVLRGHKQEIWGLTLLPDGKTLASASKDGEVCLWDTGANPLERFEGSIAATNIGNWSFTSDGSFIRALDPQRSEVVQWHLPEATERRFALESDTNSCGHCWSSDGRLLAIGCSNGVVKVWAVPGARELVRFSTSVGSAFPIRFDPEGQHVAVVGGRNLEVWDLTSTPPSRRSTWQFTEDVQIYRGRASGFGLSPDLKWLVIPEDIDKSPEEKIWLCSLASGAKTELGTIGFSYGGAFSPDNHLVAVCTGLGFARVWDTQTRRVVANLRSFLNSPSTIEFSPDGRRLAIGTTGDGLVGIWDTETWRELISLPCGSAISQKLQFSNEGNVLAALADSGELQFFRAPSFKEIELAERREAIKQP